MAHLSPQLSNAYSELSSVMAFSGQAIDLAKGDVLK